MQNILVHRTKNKTTKNKRTKPQSDTVRPESVGTGLGPSFGS